MAVSGSLADAVRYLLSTPPGRFDRADALSNILLYIPLGLFGARAIERFPGGLRVLVMALAGGILSTTIEIRTVLGPDARYSTERRDRERHSSLFAPDRSHS